MQKILKPNNTIESARKTDFGQQVFFCIKREFKLPFQVLNIENLKD